MVTTVPMAGAAMLYRVHKDRRELTRAVLGLWTALALTFFLTNCVKLMIGRPRPNFAARCWPDGHVVGLPGVPSCTGDPHAAKESRKSFPSGHSSLSFSGMGFLSLHLGARLQPWAEATNAPWRLLSTIAPLLVAGFVALTRVKDYWHHPTDVMAGTALGLACACAAFAQHGGALGGGKPPYRTLSSGAQDGSLGTRLGSAPAEAELDRQLDVV